MLFEIKSFSIPANDRPNEDAYEHSLDVKSKTILVAAIGDGVGGNPRFVAPVVGDVARCSRRFFT